MSDEEPIIDDEIVSDDEPVSDDTPSTDTTSSENNTQTPEPTPTPGAYCTRDEVNSLFGDISDDVTDELFVTSINNSTAWINANLSRNRIPLPVIPEPDPEADTVEIEVEVNQGTGLIDTGDVNTLRTAAIYYSASDILLSLYHGDELPVQYDVWFQKAQTFLDAYIEAYWNSEADEEDQLAHQVVGHSKSLTYNQKRMYRRYGR